MALRRTSDLGRDPGLAGLRRILAIEPAQGGKVGLGAGHAAA